MRDGLFEPPPSIDDTSWQGLSGLVDQAVEVLSQETKESMAALSDKTMVFRGGDGDSFTNPNFLLSFSLPNFYFHVTTVYDMLRMHDVPLGKLDFMGQIKMALNDTTIRALDGRYAQRLEGQYHDEELRELEIALPSIEVITVDIMNGEQFSDAFNNVSANQKIPGLVHGGIKLMESCAILQYLGEQFRLVCILAVLNATTLCSG